VISNLSKRFRRTASAEGANRPLRVAVTFGFTTLALSAVVAAVAFGSTTYPKTHHFKGVSEAVSIKTGSTTLLTCKLTAIGNEGDALLHPSAPVEFTACSDPQGGTGSVQATNRFWFASTSTFGVPTKVHLEMSPGAMVITLNDLTHHCVITSNGYFNASLGDTWENGLNSPLVNSESELNDSGIGAVWTNSSEGTCSQAGTNPAIALVTSASTPMVWTDTTEPAGTILIGP
jgi:hypothetical protein